MSGLLNLGSKKKKFARLASIYSGISGLPLHFFAQISLHVFSFTVTHFRNDGNTPRSLTLPTLIVKKCIFSYVIVFHSVCGAL